MLREARIVANAREDAVNYPEVVLPVRPICGILSMVSEESEMSIRSNMIEDEEWRRSVERREACHLT